MLDARSMHGLMIDRAMLVLCAFDALTMLGQCPRDPSQLRGGCFCDMFLLRFYVFVALLGQATSMRDTHAASEACHPCLA